MTIELNSEQEGLMRDILQTGEYASASDVLEVALRLLQQRDRLRSETQQGLDELDRGEGLDGDMVFSELHAHDAALACEN